MLINYEYSIYINKGNYYYNNGHIDGAINVPYYNLLSNYSHYLDKNKIELLYPCHCVSLEAKIAMANKLKINEVGVGLVLEI